MGPLEREILERLASRFREVYIFGSRARGDETLGSDVDVLVVDERFADKKYWERINWVLKEISDILEKEAVDVDVIALTPEEYRFLRADSRSIIHKISGGALIGPEAVA